MPKNFLLFIAKLLELNIGIGFVPNKGSGRFYTSAIAPPGENIFHRAILVANG